MDNKPKPATRGFASRFKDDDEEEDKPKAFIGKLKTVTEEFKPETKVSKDKLNFKSKNKIIEEDFSDDDTESKNNQQ